VFPPFTTRPAVIRERQEHACVITPPSLSLYDGLISLSHVQTADNVFGAGSPRYDNAYFEFNYIRGYTLDGVSIFSSTSTNYSSPTASHSTASSSKVTSTSSSASTPSSSSAELLRHPSIVVSCTALLSILGFWFA
jgi:hypothetical protein